VTITQMLPYAAALLVAVASPGPAMIVVISTAISRGRAPAIVTGFAIAAADVVLVILAMLGLAALISLYADAVAILKYAGAAYLIWLGIRIWSTSKTFETEHGKRGALPTAFATGAAIALGNPKAILFHASLMPLLIDLERIDLTGGGLIALIVFLVNLAVMTLYAVGASVSRRWLAKPEWLRAINRCAGLAMVGVGGLVAAR
jgi:threonine/homoserine/homoserine lactone efflux protein